MQKNISIRTARELGRRQALRDGNPFDWTTERKLHDAWAKGSTSVRFTSDRN